MSIDTSKIVSKLTYNGIDVPLGGGSLNSKTFLITLTENAPTRKVVVNGDIDVKQHYQDQSFVLGFIKIAGLETNGAHCGICSNNAMGSYYGCCQYNTNPIYYAGNVTVEQYVKVVANADGDLTLYTSNSSTRPFATGTYVIFISW